VVRSLAFLGFFLILYGCTLSPITGSFVSFAGILCWLLTALVLIDRLGRFLEAGQEDMPLIEKLGFRKGDWARIPTGRGKQTRVERPGSENIRSKWWRCSVCDTWNKVTQEECKHCGEGFVED